MTNPIRTIVTAIAGGLVVLLLSVVLAKTQGLGGVYNNVVKDFAEGISVDGTTVIDGSGNVDAPITSNSLTIGGGTAIDKIACSSATTWNPGSVGSTTVATTDVTVTGLALGDTLFGALATSTSGLGLLVTATSTDTARVTLFQPDFDAAAVDLSTTTVRVCAVSN